MTWKDRERWLNYVFCNDGRVLDEKEKDAADDKNNVEDMSGSEKSGVQLAWLRREYLVLG